jgi:arylsulfatase A-like enzyme
LDGVALSATPFFCASGGDAVFLRGFLREFDGRESKIFAEGYLMHLWRILLSTTAVLIACKCEANCGGRPNIVVFLVDDLGATDVGCFGSNFYETPRIDRLAKEGMRFTAAYASCPVCSPTRASMMTGKYPQRTGITDYINGRRTNQPENWKRNTKLLPAPYKDHLELGERTIAEELHDRGYATYFAGKWHLGGRGFLPTDQGFDVNKGGLDWGAPKSYFSPYGNPLLPDGPPGESLTRRLAAETCEFISANHEQSFFAYLSFYSVHVPLQGPEKLIDKYREKAAGLKQDDAAWGKERNSKVRLVQDNAVYAAMIEETDIAIGMVLDKLDEMKLAENTIVLFTSDNGGLSTAEGWSTSNLPFRGGKGWMYEGGTRVPSIVRWPGVTKEGSVCDTPIISMDYFPTFVASAGRPIERDDWFDGVDLAPLFRGENIKPRVLFWDYPHYGNQGGAPASAVREGKWKLIEWREDDSSELFDLEADPGEHKDLGKAEPEVVSRLRDKLEKWRVSVGATTPSPNPRFESKPLNK